MKYLIILLLSFILINCDSSVSPIDSDTDTLYLTDTIVDTNVIHDTSVIYDTIVIDNAFEISFYNIGVLPLIIESDRNTKQLAGGKKVNWLMRLDEGIQIYLSDSLVYYGTVTGNMDFEIYHYTVTLK